MNVLQSRQLLLVSLVGWINRHEEGVIACIQEENHILKGEPKGMIVEVTRF